MVLKVVGNEQIVCDCTGDTPLTYQDRLLIGIIVRKDDVTFEVHCPECECCKHFVIRNEFSLSWTSALDLVHVH